MPTTSFPTLELSAAFSYTCVALLALLIAILQGKPIKMLLLFFLASNMTELFHPTLTEVLLTLRDT